MRNSHRHYFWYHHWTVGSDATNCPFGVEIFENREGYVCHIDISNMNNGIEDMLPTAGETWEEINEIVKETDTYVKVFMPKLNHKNFLY